MIEVRHLTKKFKNTTIVEDVNMQIEDGTIVGIIGRNGSGKTVLFKMIAGLLKPTEGVICVDKVKIGVDRDFPESMGIIIETPTFISYKSGYDNLKSLAMIRNQIGDAEIKHVLKLVGLEQHATKKVSKYSLGMRQRLGIAQAIMENPKLLILDEPMNGLDEEGVEEVRQLLLKLKKEGKTIFLASHNKEDIVQLCDRVFQMSGGKLQEREKERKKED